MAWTVCWKCNERFGLDDATEAALRRSGLRFHCPWGHPAHFSPGPTKEDELRLERDRLKQALAEKDDQIALQRKWRLEEEERRVVAERSASAMRGQVTKLKKRAANGVCPCCNRTFVDLRRHMATKHAGFVEESAAPDGVAIQ